AKRSSASRQVWRTICPSARRSPRWNRPTSSTSAPFISTTRPSFHWRALLGWRKHIGRIISEESKRGRRAKQRPRAAAGSEDRDAIGRAGATAAAVESPVHRDRGNCAARNRRRVVLLAFHLHRGHGRRAG